MNFQKGKNLQKMKQWYYEAVMTSLIQGGKSKEEAEEILKVYRLRELLDRFPYVQMHYSIEDATEEALEIFDKFGPKDLALVN